MRYKVKTWSQDEGWKTRKKTNNWLHALHELSVWRERGYRASIIDMEWDVEKEPEGATVRTTA